MILDIVENLILYVEPVTREHREQYDNVRFALRLSSPDDVAIHRQRLARKQNMIRSRIAHLRVLERTHHCCEKVCLVTSHSCGCYTGKCGVI